MRKHNPAELFRRAFSLFTAVSAASVCLGGLQVYASDAPLEITVQPQDAEVSYPDGAEFHVEVSQPENVSSYQWEVTDGYNVFVLKGSSASTDTLVVPSTTQDDPELVFHCIITDIFGNTTVSREAHLTKNNAEEDKTVLFVGDYAVEPGEALDVSETGMGSGRIIFDRNGYDITLNHVTIDNTVMTYDRQIAPSLGFLLERRNSEVDEYYFHLDGDCHLTNTFFDTDYNNGGVTFNAYFASKDKNNHPAVVIDGDGTLYIKGGSNYIYTDGELDLYTDVVGETGGDFFTDGITCHNLYVEKDTSLTLNVNGTAIHTEGDLYTYENAVLDIKSTPARVSVGPTVKDISFIMGSVHSVGSKINISVYGDPDRFVPYGQYLMMANAIGLNGTGAIYADGTEITIEMTAGESDEPFAGNFGGISGAETGNTLDLAKGSKVNIKIDAPQVSGCSAVNLGGKIILENDTELISDVNGAGETFGMIAGLNLQINDAVLDSKVVSSTGEAVYGVVCGEADIDLTEKEFYFHSVAEGGIAFAADTGERSDDEIPFEEGYEPQVIKFSGKAAVVTPAKNVISVHGVPGYGSLIRAETVFDKADTSKPASEVMIGIPESGGAVIYGILAAAALAGAVFIFLRRGKKQEQ